MAWHFGSSSSLLGMRPLIKTWNFSSRDSWIYTWNISPAITWLLLLTYLCIYCIWHHKKTILKLNCRGGDSALLITQSVHEFSQDFPDGCYIRTTCYIVKAISNEASTESPVVAQCPHCLYQWGFCSLTSQCFLFSFGFLTGFPFRFSLSVAYVRCRYTIGSRTYVHRELKRGKHCDVDSETARLLDSVAMQSLPKKIISSFAKRKGIKYEPGALQRISVAVVLSISGNGAQRDFPWGVIPRLPKDSSGRTQCARSCPQWPDIIASYFWNFAQHIRVQHTAAMIRRDTARSC